MIIYAYEWSDVGEVAALNAFFHAFYSTHFFLTAGWIREKMHAVKDGKCILVKMKE